MDPGSALRNDLRPSEQSGVTAAGIYRFSALWMGANERQKFSGLTPGHGRGRLAHRPRGHPPGSSRTQKNVSLKKEDGQAKRYVTTLGQPPHRC